MHDITIEQVKMITTDLNLNEQYCRGYNGGLSRRIWE